MASTRMVVLYFLCILLLSGLCVMLWYFITDLNQRKSINTKTQQLQKTWYNIIPHTNANGVITDNTIHIPIYYINLNRSKHRRLRFENETNAISTNITRITAIDGAKKVIVKNSHRVMDGMPYVTNYKMTKYQFACTLSHIKAIRQIEKDNVEVALICEDDVSFSLLPFWPKDILKHILSNTPPETGIVQLYWGRHEIDACKISSQYQLRKREKKPPCWGTVAYLITKKGVADVLNYVLPDRNGVVNLQKNQNGFPSFGAADIFIYQLTNVYITSLPLFVFKGNEMSSTINASSELGNMVYYNNIMAAYINTVKESIVEPNIKGRKNVFMFWEGKSYILLKILHQLVHKHSKNNAYDVHFITYKNMYKYLPKEIPDNMTTWKLAHQADYLRVALLYKYGGVWVDADTIVMPNFRDVFKMLETKKGFFVLENNESIWNGVFGSKPNTKLLSEWKQYILERSDRGAKFQWTEIGNAFLEKHRDHIFTNYHVLNGLDTVYPINWPECTHEFVTKPYINYKNLIRNYQPFVVIVNSVYKKIEDENMSVQEIIYGKTMPISYFIKKSNK